MALLHLENFDTFDTIAGGVYRNYSGLSRPTLPRGYRGSANPRHNLTTSGEGKSGGKAINVPFLLDNPWQDSGNSSHGYANAGAGYFLPFETTQSQNGPFRVYCGWFKVSNFASSNVILTLGNASNQMFALRLHTDGHLYAYQTNSDFVNCFGEPGYDTSSLLPYSTTNYIRTSRLGIEYGNSTSMPAPPIERNKWHFFEIKVDIASSGGEVVVKIDNETVINFTGNTVKSGADSITRMMLCNYPVISNTASATTATGVSGDLPNRTNGIVTSTFWDSLFMLDSSGSKINDFVGPSTLYTLKPNQTIANGQGGDNPFTETGASSAHAALATMDEDASYIAAAAPGNITIGYDNLSEAGDILAVAVGSFAKRNGASGRTLTHRAFGQNMGPAKALDTSYKFVEDISTSTPGGAWTKSSVDALQVTIENE